MKKLIPLIALLGLLLATVTSAQEMQGKVLDISVEYGFVFLDLGEGSGVSAGDMFVVLGPGDAPAARVKITKVYTDLSEGDIVEKINPGVLRGGLRVVAERARVSVPPPDAVEPPAPAVTVPGPDEPAAANLALPSTLTSNLVRSIAQAEVIVHPLSVAVAPDRVIYFTDTRHHALLVWQDGAGAASLQTSTEDPARPGIHFGRAPGQFVFPGALACDAQGNVFVVDTMNHRVQVVNRSGVVLRELGGLGATPGRMLKPGGITVSAQGDIYVADSGNDRVQQFTAQGAFVREIGVAGNGRLARPYGLAFDASGNLLVVDSRNQRVVVFDRSGNYLREFGRQILVAPRGIAVDPAGNIYVADPSSRSVRVFDAREEYIGEIADWVMDRPFDVAWHPDGFLLVADAAANALLQYQITVVTP